jgi:hypothetical protein
MQMTGENLGKILGSGQQDLAVFTPPSYRLWPETWWRWRLTVEVPKDDDHTVPPLFYA